MNSVNQSKNLRRHSFWGSSKGRIATCTSLRMSASLNVARDLILLTVLLALLCGGFIK